MSNIYLTSTKSITKILNTHIFQVFMTVGGGIKNILDVTDPDAIDYLN